MNLLLLWLMSKIVTDLNLYNFKEDNRLQRESHNCERIVLNIKKRREKKNPEFKKWVEPRGG